MENGKWKVENEESIPFSTFHFPFFVAELID